MSKLPLYLLFAVLVAAAAVVTAECIESLPADAGSRAVTVQLEDGSVQTVDVDAAPDESLAKWTARSPACPWAGRGAPRRQAELPGSPAGRRSSRPSRRPLAAPDARSSARRSRQTAPANLRPSPRRPSPRKPPQPRRPCPRARRRRPRARSRLRRPDRTRGWASGPSARRRAEQDAAATVASTKRSRAATARAADEGPQAQALARRRTAA